MMHPVHRWLRGVLSIVVLSGMTPGSGSAETISVPLDALRGTYGPGRIVAFDLGTRFSSIRGASVTLTGSGTPGLYEQCDLFGTGGCRQFQRPAEALYWIEREDGPGIYAFLGSFSLPEEEATATAALCCDPERLRVFLDGRGQVRLMHSSVVSFPEQPIYVLEAPEFSVTDFVLDVDGIVFRGADFEDLWGVPGALDSLPVEISSRGFRFTSANSGLSFSNWVARSSGTFYLTQNAGEGAKEIRMVRADGQPFSLAQFDVAEGPQNTAPALRVHGLRSDGTELEREIALDGVADGSGGARDFETVRLDPSWTGLEQVRFTGLAEPGNGTFALDDIVASPPEDLDQDGADDAFDGCPGLHDPEQRDTDADGIGDACNDAQDYDGDEWSSLLDNCPVAANPDQANRDSDRFGDVCDYCPDHPSLGSDEDRNGIGDECECGDQNEDRRVNVSDLVAINLALLGSSEASPLCDTNYDGRCDVRDIVGASRKIYGQPAYCSHYPPPLP
jgi:hypothetical protein